MHTIKFRVWSNNKIFCHESLIDNVWHVEFIDKEKVQGRIRGTVVDKLVRQQFTGLTDKSGQEVYEGDIIKFKYSVGDFAWEFMNLEEKERENKMLGKTFTCIVTWVEYNAGFELISGDEKSTHTNFPMLYCKTGKVIGNIFQNKL